MQLSSIVENQVVLAFGARSVASFPGESRRDWSFFGSNARRVTKALSRIIDQPPGRDNRDQKHLTPVCKIASVS
jgi:hypothetical protein